MFGEADALCGIRRNGTAIAVTYCQLYRATKSTIDEVLLNFPDIKKKITEQAFEEQKVLTHYRLKLLQRNPVYGFKNMQKQAMHNIKSLTEQIKFKLDEFIQSKHRKKENGEDSPIIQSPELTDNQDEDGK